MSNTPISLHPYGTQHRLDNLNLDALDDLLQEAVTSSIPSSPTSIDFTIYNDTPAVKFKDSEAEVMESDEEADPTYCLPDPEPRARRALQTRCTDEQKVGYVLQKNLYNVLRMVASGRPSRYVVYRSLRQFFTRCGQ